ncbi:MAG: hypothetical protein KDC13_04120 [Bacteroidetes bacterium]|nr:hypothetical protein [Bacteroidota bacterium]
MNEEEQLTEDNFFETDELYKIAALVNETISSVVYHYWVNKSHGQRFEVLDWITLNFNSGNHMWLTAGEESDGIKLLEADIPALKNKLESEFKGVVTLESKDVSGHKIWKPVLGKPITPSLIQVGDKALNDTLVLKFEGADSIEISLGIEGLEVEFFEEDI